MTGQFRSGDLRCHFAACWQIPPTNQWKIKDKARLKGNPVFEVFRHVRNAASHGNAWYFTPHEPAAHGEWKGIVIDETLKGDNNPLQGKPYVYGTL